MSRKRFGTMSGRCGNDHHVCLSAAGNGQVPKAALGGTVAESSWYRGARRTPFLLAPRFVLGPLPPDQRQEDEIGGGGDTCPAVVKDIEQRDELGGGLLVAGRRGMVITGWISGGVVGDRLLVLNSSVPPTVVVAVVPPQVVDVGIPSIAGQDIVKVEDGHIIEGVTVLGQPVVHQPLVEGAGVGGVGGVGERRGGDDDEEFIGTCREVLQDFVIDIFGVTYRQPAIRRGRVVGIPSQGRVGEAGFEHDDLVLAAGIRQCARVG